MEDAHVAIEVLPPPPGFGDGAALAWPQMSFYAVYDGHGGGECAEYAKAQQLAMKLYKLHSNDQLRWSMDTGLSFVGFEEAVIEFRPTYKFDTGSDVYDSGPKQRIQAWSARVLDAPHTGTDSM